VPEVPFGDPAFFLLIPLGFCSTPSILVSFSFPPSPFRFFWTVGFGASAERETLSRETFLSTSLSFGFEDATEGTTVATVANVGPLLRTVFGLVKDSAFTEEAAALEVGICLVAPCLDTGSLSESRILGLGAAIADGDNGSTLRFLAPLSPPFSK
jgi:hypothetical protein